MRKHWALLVLVAACSKEEARPPAAAETPPAAKPAEPAASPAPAPSPATAEPTGEPETVLDLAEGTTQMNAASVKIEPGDDDETRIYKQVRNRISQVNYCYAKQRKIEPRLAGKMTVKITVAPAPKGAVTTAEVTENRMKSPEVESCVLSTVRTFAFQRKGKDEIAVHLPFIFR